VESTYRGLKKAWIGLRIAKRERDIDKMKHYAEGIQKFEKQLNHPVSGLSDLLMGKELSNASENQEKRSTQSKVADN
jgi:hypothetical protein